MDRLVNFVLVGATLAALVAGAVWLGSTVRDDSVSRLTESIPAAAAAATADSQLRAAVFAANGYFAQHSTYVGMSADELRSDIDAGLAAELSVEDATASAFCVETEVGKQTFSYSVRKGFLTPGSGC
jgi:hypothetical protein